MVIFHSYVSLPEGSGDAVNCSQTWWLPLRIKKTTHHNFRPVKPLPSGYDIHSLPWKDPPMLLSSVNHLFRLGPWLNHGELLLSSPRRWHFGQPIRNISLLEAPRPLVGSRRWVSGASRSFSPWLVNSITNVAVDQNLVPLVNIKIAGKWMFIPLKMVCIGIDP